MANKASRPGRTLIVFALVVIAMYGGLALNGVWAPKLGLDLQGGTRITLSASTSTGEEITPEKLEEAAAIIDSRVNGQGVAESEVATQGGDTIIVEIPGQNRKDLVDTVQQTAQLRFRLVAAAAPGTQEATQPQPEPSESTDGGGGNGGGGNGGGGNGGGGNGGGGNTGDDAAQDETVEPSDDSSPAGRAVSEGLLRLGNANNDTGGGTDANGGVETAPETVPEAGGRRSRRADPGRPQGRTGARRRLRPGRAAGVGARTRRPVACSSSSASRARATVRTRRASRSSPATRTASSTS